MTHEPSGHIRINGEQRPLPRARNLCELLDELGYGEQMVAVALNRACVRRADLAATAVHDGDDIEILAPMAGG